MTHVALVCLNLWTWHVAIVIKYPTVKNLSTGYHSPGKLFEFGKLNTHAIVPGKPSEPSG
ncbi:hypothetical protein KC19_11G135900 [Ceratodon purpureus]|uniref:Uncharacterized protein n=1 Tax=Ceratodon purpureus TaxID=3225 RepID=A0A8T0GFT5_CERPU|nr:hypothetical protein KC19_11G135900 [Ceratodon purpureus]